MKRYLLYISLALLISVSTGCARTTNPVEIDVNAQTAVIIDAGNGKVLFEKNADSRFPPASTAKVMTAIVAIESLSPEKEIVAGKNVARVEPTVAPLAAGVRYRLRDLLHAILIKSANDAAVVIAEGVAGSEEGFVKLMNEEAGKIGMTDTYFATVSGLPTGKKDEQYTTARDLAKMMRYALRHKAILEIMSKREARIRGSDGREIYLKTHNRALFRSDEAPWGKTGYTKQARRTFVGTDPSMTPRVIFALLRSNDLWNDITTLKDRGLELYEESHRTIISDIAEWVRLERRKGRESGSRE